jgi:hypothetical protein
VSAEDEKKPAKKPKQLTVEQAAEAVPEAFKAHEASALKALAESTPSARVPDRLHGVGILHAGQVADRLDLRRTDALACHVHPVVAAPVQEPEAVLVHERPVALVSDVLAGSGPPA